MEIANLTKKEQEIRDLIASCYSDSEIAKELKIELSTIATHKNHIFQKLLIFGKHRRLELIKQEMQQIKLDLECAELRNKYDREKFDSELQQLKTGNEELKKTLVINKDAFNSICVDKYKLEQKLEKIKELLESYQRSGYDLNYERIIKIIESEE